LQTHQLIAAPELIFNKTKEDPATDFDFFVFPLLLKFKSGKNSLEKAYKRKSNVDLENPRSASHKTQPEYCEPCCYLSVP
jgi:hypothetical protein